MGIFDIAPPIYPPPNPVTPIEPAKKPGVLLGEAEVPVYQEPQDRINHLYIIGLPRHGKTELMKNLMLQDMQQGNGIGFIDPHSQAATQMLGLVPKNRIKDVIFFDPFDPKSPSFNPMRLPFKPYKIVGDLLSIFKMFYGDSWSTPQEHILRSVLLTLLLDSKPHCIADIKRVLTEPEYHDDLDIHPDLKSFWENEFERLPKTSIQSLTNKLSLILLPGSPQQRVFSDLENDLNFPEIIQENKILIVKLSKSDLGEDASRLLGGFIVAGLQQAALDRDKTHEDLREPFYLYVDEFQNFTANSFGTILTESPKFKLYLTMAHQFMDDLPEHLQNAIAGTVGSRVCFQVSSKDAQKVKSIMNVSRMLWRRGEGDWEPMSTFRDYALQRIETCLELYKNDALLTHYQRLLRETQTAFTPTQLRGIASRTIKYIDNNEVHRTHFPFNVEIQQEEFPEKFELGNLPKYVAFVRLGSNERVYRIKTLKCPDPDPMIAEHILLKRPHKERKPEKPLPVEPEKPRIILHPPKEEFSPTPEKKPVDNAKIEGNGRKLTADDIRIETIRKRPGRPRKKTD